MSDKKMYVVRFRGLNGRCDVFVCHAVYDRLPTDLTTLLKKASLFSLDEAIKYTRKETDISTWYLPAEVVEVVEEEEEEQVEEKEVVQSIEDVIDSALYVIRYGWWAEGSATTYHTGSGYTTNVKEAGRTLGRNLLASKHPIMFGDRRLPAQIVRVEVKPGERVLKLGEVV